MYKSKIMLIYNDKEFKDKNIIKVIKINLK
jgi:hypothetical protein